MDYEAIIKAFWDINTETGEWPAYLDAGLAILRAHFPEQQAGVFGATRGTGREPPYKTNESRTDIIATIDKTPTEQRAKGGASGETRHCPGCQGHIDHPCSDPQCGDSTWDHVCDKHSESCPGLASRADPNVTALRDALSQFVHGGRLTYEDRHRYGCAVLHPDDPASPAIIDEIAALLRSEPKGEVQG